LVNYDDDDLTLSIQATWLESNGCGFDRVVILDFFCSDCLMSDDRAFNTVGQSLRDRIEAKLERDLGLVHRRDYIFGIYDNPVMKDGVWVIRPIPGDMRTIVRIKDEEHFVMFKMHYSDN
jgi:hypothetical protein